MKFFLFAIFISLINILGSHNLALAVAVENYSNEASTLGSNDDDFEDSVDLTGATKFRSLQELRDVTTKQFSSTGHECDTVTPSEPSESFQKDLFDSNVAIDQVIPIAQDDQSQQIQADLSRLQALGVKLHESTLEEIAGGNSWVLLKIDPCEGLNLLRIAVAVFCRILETKEGEYAIIDETVRQQIIGFVTSIDQLIEQSKACGFIDFHDQKASDIYSDAMNKLNTLIVDIQKHGEVKSVVKSENGFNMCCICIKKFMELIYTRFAAEALLAQVRSALENIQTKTSSTSAEGTFGIPLPTALSVSGTIYASSSVGTSDISFMTTSTSQGFTLNFSIDLKALNLNASVGYETTKSDLTFSLEGMFDLINNAVIKKGIYGGGDMKAAADQRKGQQSMEKSVLLYCNVFEQNLKNLCVIPDSAYLQWVIITKSHTSLKQKDRIKTGSIDATIGIGKLSAGVSIIGLTGSKTYSQGINVLDYVNNDLSPADGMDVAAALVSLKDPNPLKKTKSGKEITVFLLCEMSKKYIYAIVRLSSLKIALKELEKHKKTVKFKGDKKVDANQIKSMIDEIKVLSRLKHEIEGEFCLKERKQKGRVGLMRIMLASAMLLRMQNSLNLSALVLFRTLYEQLKRLDLLSNYSKNSKGIRKVFNYGTKNVLDRPVKAKFSSIILSASVSVPSFLRPTSSLDFCTSIAYEYLDGSPFFDDNGHAIVVEVDVPMGMGGFAVVQALQRKYTNIFKNKRLSCELRDFSDVLVSSSLSDGLSVALGSLGLDTFAGNSNANCCLVYIYNAKNTNPKNNSLAAREDYSPLPLMNEYTLEPKGKWALGYVVYSCNANLELAASVAGNDVRFAASRGNSIKMTGSNSLYAVTAKWNVYCLGEADSVSKRNDGIKNNLIKEYAKQLVMALYTVGYRGTVSYELQEMFNDMLENAKTENERAEIRKAMQTFMEICLRLNGLRKEGAEGTCSYVPWEKMPKRPMEASDDMVLLYQEALNAFKVLLDLNYLTVFLKYYNAAFKIAA